MWVHNVPNFQEVIYMKELCKSLDNLPKIVKLIFCLPVLNIVWAIYRIGEGIASKNNLHLVLGILWVVFGPTIGWLLDLICMLLTGHIFWFKA